MIECKNINIKAGQFELRDISFNVPHAKYYCLMGKTGSGKTTILEAICGLRLVQGGYFYIDGKDITRCKPSMRDIGFVPQDNALFSTMTVKEHLAFALKIRKWKKQERKERVEELAELLGITDLLSRKPFGLSGGEKQRVALGRALSFRPKVLCLDEPLSALDDQTKEEMYHLMESICKSSDVTVLHISHSFIEVSRLADGVIYLEDGKISCFLKEDYDDLRERMRL